MKISFLVTYYQQERYVRESMESLLALKKPGEWEILIGDDGSSDGTVSAAMAYVNRDPEHIRLFVMDRDPGRKYNPVERASLNRLNLVRQATGDCYMLMDGDDFYSDTDFLPEAAGLLESHPEVSVIALGTWLFQEGGSRQAPGRGTRKVKHTPRSRYLRWQYTHAGACLIRNGHTEENLAMLESLGSFDDNDIVLNALARGELIRLDRPVYAYRQAEGSVYTAMNPAEQAALNLAGLGACLRIMGPAWERDVLARFAAAVWQAWFLRKTLKSEMDPLKYQRYLEGCGRAEFREGEMLLRYPELNRGGKKRIRKYVRRAGWASPPRVVYAWMRVHRRGRKL